MILNNWGLADQTVTDIDYDDTGNQNNNAWFSEQDKYFEIYDTNKRMTAWLIEKFDELKDI